MDDDLLAALLAQEPEPTPEEWAWLRARVDRIGGIITAIESICGPEARRAAAEAFAWSDWSEL